MPDTIHMSAQRKTPDKNTLERWLEEGLTHQQMADRVLELTGESVTRGAISIACSRYGLSQNGHRYTETLPWRVMEVHARQYPARMLRLLGRSREGQEMPVDERARLERWMALLARENAVVAYSPRDGFLYTERLPEDLPGLPIRRQLVERAEGAA